MIEHLFSLRNVEPVDAIQGKIAREVTYKHTTPSELITRLESLCITENLRFPYNQSPEDYQALISQLSEESQDTLLGMTGLADQVDLIGHISRESIIRLLQNLITAEPAKYDQISEAILNKFSDIDYSLVNQEVIDHLSSLDQTSQLVYILQNLARGRGKCTIDEPSIFYQKVDPEKFNLTEDDAQLLESVIETIHSFINAPLILDGFEDDQGNEFREDLLVTVRRGRRGWRGRMQDLFGNTFYEFYKSNKVIGNRISNLDNAIVLLEMVLPSNPALRKFKQVFFELLPESKASYNPLPLKEKIKVLKQLDLAARTFLTELASAA